MRDVFLCLAGWAFLYATPVFSAPIDVDAASTEDRPSEESLFGESPSSDSTSAEQQSTNKTGDSATDARSALTEPTSTSIWESQPDDPLKMGGVFYMRAETAAMTQDPPSEWSFSVPTIVDGYFDARPNERVRGFLLTRLKYDPAIPESSSNDGDEKQSQRLQLDLDQLWIRFDLMRSVFVTFGKQHIKWGSGRFWNPTDFLHPVSLDPLASMDTRSGVTMLKLHFPWEKNGWNFYGVGIFEDLDTANTLGKIGGALRAEIVVGPAELGLDLVAQKGHKTKFGLDISSGLGPLDAYAELALTRDTERWRPSHASGGSQPYEKFLPSGYEAQLVTGMNWSMDYLVKNVFTFGTEYFYNSSGYDGKEIYSWLWNNNGYRPYYLGKHYWCVYGSFSGPASIYNLGITLSNVTNLSDRSYVSRIHSSIIVLSHLELEAYTAFHYGNKGGEFRFALDLPATENSPETHIASQQVEFGVGVKIKI